MSKKRASRIGLVVGLIVGFGVGYYAASYWSTNTYMPTSAGILICGGLIAAGAFIGALIGVLSGALIFTINTKLKKS